MVVRRQRPESASIPPLHPREKRKRKRESVAIGFLALAFLGLTGVEFQLTRFSSSLPFVNSIFFFGLLNVNIVILVALVWLIFRNIGKLFIERRRRILGARLKTKLVTAFLAFSIIPTVVLFIISAAYINSSFDKWFSLKIQNTFQASLEITQHFYRQKTQTARHFAEHLSRVLGARAGAPATGFLNQQRDLLALDALEFYVDPLDERVVAQNPALPELRDSYPRLALDLLQKAFSGEIVTTVQHVGAGDLIRCLVPVRSGGEIVGAVAVGSYIPVNLVNKVDEIELVLNDYKDTNPLKYPVKTTYFVILVMITLVIIFVAIWIGFYLARELTDPVERLVHGAQEVGAGNLDVSISTSGHDEISVLVESFNHMTRDLRDGRERLIQASRDLERRRLQLEAVLANVGTGVVVVDHSGVVTTFNRAVSELLHLSPEAVLGKSFSEVFGPENAPLQDLIAGAARATAPETVQWNVRSANQSKSLTAIATPLREGANTWGVVAVIDDMTLLVKGQREMAWSEVARRIAHEIKNPLTPIKLSAQRLQRRLVSIRGREGQILQECTDTIIKHTDELKEMVNEFSNFARFPEVSLARNDLNTAITEVVSLFTQAHPSFQFVLRLEDRLTSFDFDRDQMKRVLINLLDNAVSAVQALPAARTRRVEVATHYHERLQMAVIEVSDNGPGMSEETRSRVFEPYFSTKKEGTGLGLAIVKRIVNDHDGFIRVHSVVGEGTQFLIELPTARKTFENLVSKQSHVEEDPSH